MPEKKGVKLDKDENGSGNMKVSIFTDEELVAISKDESLFHIIGMWTRPWVGYYCNYLEYEHFLPETPENQEFQFRVFKWKDILWAIVSIPINKKNLAYEAATASHLRLADGVPLMMGSDVVKLLGSTREDKQSKDLGEFFPLNCERAFTLENQKDDVTYDGPGGMQDAKASEKFALHKLWGKHGVPDDPTCESDPWEGA
jgi:hypothetical protein